MKYLIIVLLALTVTLSSQANDAIEISLNNLIQAAEAKYSLPQGLLGAIVKVESSGNHKALNRDDGTKAHKEQGLKIRSYGLMQIQLDSARLIQKLKAKRDGFSLKNKDLLTARQLMSPEANLDYGAAYLKWLLETHNNNVAWSLSCYNAGPNSFICKNKKYIGEYVGKVLNAMIEGN